jgi:hypothetical protein
LKQQAEMTGTCFQLGIFVLTNNAPDLGPARFVGHAMSTSTRFEEEEDSGESGFADIKGFGEFEPGCFARDSPISFPFRHCRLLDSGSVGKFLLCSPFFQTLSFHRIHEDIVFRFALYIERLRMDFMNILQV